MTLAELKAILDQTGYPVTYSHFKGTPENPVPYPPYICYLEVYSTNLFADNRVYKKYPNIQIELYTKNKDLIAESKLESVLDGNEIPYETNENFIDSQSLFQKIYEVRLI
ncbi:hypothetical protein IHV09_14185 [Fictibacillus sp. 23RED33]|uniref:hypothetical protein n=1 Tax=Fictibacillus sp. 23RED33 TaxID=2745879 RepID=UPI0018CFDC3E|nr:hypothetical protein [Fictibacillus sp. 23RED33]MBH0174713.1 hypothetical protein [Fictibacillus sp. 23RED33]